MPYPNQLGDSFRIRHAYTETDMRAGLFIMVAIAAWPISGAVMAQVPPGPLKPLDQNVSDVSPLSASFRDTSIDLRQPSGFQNVFRVPGKNDLLMRINGGIYAVFPQSEYAKRDNRVVPLIPAGTVFYIGQPAVTAQAEPIKLPPPQMVLSGVGMNLVQGELGREIDTHVIEPQHDIDRYRAASAYLAGPHAPDQLTLSQMLPMRPQDDLATRSTATALPLSQPKPVNAQQESQATALQAKADAHSSTTILNDAEFRMRRIDELLHRAAESAKRKSPSDGSSPGAGNSSGK